MALNPDDLFEREFEETRLRPGYDKAQVNEFLDGVQAELRRLITENEALRDKVYEQGGAPAFAGGWEGPVEAAQPGGTAWGEGMGSAEMADDGFVPAGAGAGLGSPEAARQEADQRVMAAMHAAETAEFEAHHRIQAVRREQQRAEAELERVKQRVAGLAAAADRVERAGDEGAAAGDLLRAAQRLHDEHVWAAEESAREREQHTTGRLEALEVRITDARQRLREAEAMLRDRAQEFADWAAEQRRHLAAPSTPEPAPSGPVEGVDEAPVEGRPAHAAPRVTGASSLWG